MILLKKHKNGYLHLLFVEQSFSSMEWAKKWNPQKFLCSFSLWCVSYFFMKLEVWTILKFFDNQNGFSFIFDTQSWFLVSDFDSMQYSITLRGGGLIHRWLNMQLSHLTLEDRLLVLWPDFNQVFEDLNGLWNVGGLTLTAKIHHEHWSKTNGQVLRVHLVSWRLGCHLWQVIHDVHQAVLDSKMKASLKTNIDSIWIPTYPNPS